MARSKPAPDFAKRLVAQNWRLRRILSTYKRHLLWDIEQLFRTIKTQGFDIEDSQIETFAVMRKLIAAALVAALRALQLVHARNGDTGQKLTDAVEEADEPLVEALVQKFEGKTDKLKCPHPKARSAASPGSSGASAVGMVTSAKAQARRPQDHGPRPHPVDAIRRGLEAPKCVNPLGLQTAVSP